MNSDFIQQQQPRKIAYVTAVIAKCPIAGQSKTRLQPLFASTTTTATPNETQLQPKDGTSILAKAMLRDVLVSISHCCRQAHTDNSSRNRSNSHNRTNNNNINIVIDQLLFYAPPTTEGYEMMQEIVNSCHDIYGNSISDDWTLLPIDNTNPSNTKNATNGDYESRRSNLSNILSNVVRTGHHRNPTIPTTVILFGMDAPEIPMLELYTIITTPKTASASASAFLCPAYDGGYVMLSIPPLAQEETVHSIFQSVSPYWSHPLTSIAQIKALSDVGISTIIGPIVHDIDTPDDVLALLQRLKSEPVRSPYDTIVAAANVDKKIKVEGCCLHRPSVLRHSPTSTFHEYVPCQHVRQALIDLQLF